jgi:hypothetical protein
VEAYDAVFRHLFHVSTDDVWEWPQDRYDRHRMFADAWLQANNLEMKG